MTEIKKIKKKKSLQVQILTAFLLVFDIASVLFSWFFALWIRHDCLFRAIPESYLSVYQHTILLYASLCVILFAIFKLYRSLWQFASYMELLRLFIASAIGFITYLAALTIKGRHMPVSYYIFGLTTQVILTLGVRFFYRFVVLLHEHKGKSKSHKHIMIIGAGRAGQMIVRDVNSAGCDEEVCCFIDDDVNKHGRFIDGVEIVGGREQIPEAVKTFNIDKIYVALPSLELSKKKKILNICSATGCELMNLPGMAQLRRGEVAVSQMKPVDVEDLLGRDPIRINLDEIFRSLTGKVILVTGGGGSIGSELCRQIAAHAPKQLVIVDIYENNAYDIQQELKYSYPELNLQVRIGSVRDSRFIFKIFEEFRPEYVYHAAAHKHVPLMEDVPCEAIKNNVIGTYKTAYAAMVHGCRRFVLISTDKAVNPTNIMGASKRLCEMICQAFDKKVKEGKASEIPQLFTHQQNEELMTAERKAELLASRTEFVAVRFGNVLGSNGSVIPLFRKQIAHGGPVTVTHPEIIRYFMTIPEAVSLVLEAGTLAHGGEIFVLDMGDPVKIDDLARNLIRLSGYQPDVDIKIEYTGLRPGEKLYEEKLMAEEGLEKTSNELIHIGKPLTFDIESFLGNLGDLMTAAYKNQDSGIKDKVAEMVNTYKPAE